MSNPKHSNSHLKKKQSLLYSSSWWYDLNSVLNSHFITVTHGQQFSLHRKSLGLVSCHPQRTEWNCQYKFKHWILKQIWTSKIGLNFSQCFKHILSWKMLLYNQTVAWERRNSYTGRDLEKKHQRWYFAEDSLQISRKSVLQKHSLNKYTKPGF